MNQLEALKQFTTVVADTGNFEQISQFAPKDATTNPSLVMQAVRDPKYRPLFDQVVDGAKGDTVDLIADKVVVATYQELGQ